MQALVVDHLEIKGMGQVLVLPGDVVKYLFLGDEQDVERPVLLGDGKGRQRLPGPDFHRQIEQPVLF